MEEKHWQYIRGVLDGTKEMERVLMQEGILKTPKCKYCGSYHVVRFGHSKQMQRLLCHDCGHTFMDSDTLPTMKTSAEQIASAVNTYYEGLSLNAVRRNLHQTYGIYPSDSTVYEWLTRYTKEAIKEADKFHPQVGDHWVVDETVIHKNWGGRKRRLWLIDIIDTDTRFLLGTKLSHNRSKEDIRVLMEKARGRAGKTPKEVWSDGWGGYRDGIELAFGAETKHVITTPFGDADDSSTLIERWHGTLKDRTKVMRGLKTKETAQLILDGWLMHYNFFRPHESLDGKTPAQKANIKFPHANWQSIITIPDKTVSKPKLSNPEYRKLRITPPVPRISPKMGRLR